MVVFFVYVVMLILLVSAVTSVREFSAYCESCVKLRIKINCCLVQSRYTGHSIATTAQPF